MKMYTKIRGKLKKTTDFGLALKNEFESSRATTRLQEFLKDSTNIYLEWIVCHKPQTIRFTGAI